jgi:hypothetical protein
MVMEEEPMSDHTSQEHHPMQEQARELWASLDGLDPVEEYRRLACELQEWYPDAEARHLDLLIAREMATYSGFSVEAITRAMLEASLALASDNISNAQDYVDRTVDEAMQENPTQGTGLGWG